MLEKLLEYKLWKEIIGDIIGGVLLLTPFVIIGFILVLGKIKDHKYNKKLLHRNRKNHQKTIGVFDLENIRDTTKMIGFLKDEYPKGIQMFMTQNISDDFTCLIYHENEITIHECYQYNYIEISGLTTNEFDIVCKAVNKHHWLKRKFSD
jgi:hypothetical protein